MDDYTNLQYNTFSRLKTLLKEEQQELNEFPSLYRYGRVAMLEFIVANELEVLKDD